jgi:hypothetical protein
MKTMLRSMGALLLLAAYVELWVYDAKTYAIKKLDVPYGWINSDRVSRVSQLKLVIGKQTKRGNLCRVSS